MLKLRLLLVALSACALWLGVTSAAHAVRYSNAGMISINDATNASPAWCIHASAPDARSSALSPNPGGL